MMRNMSLQDRFKLKFSVKATQQGLLNTRKGSIYYGELQDGPNKEVHITDRKNQKVHTLDVSDCYSDESTYHFILNFIKSEILVDEKTETDRKFSLKLLDSLTTLNEDLDNKGTKHPYGKLKIDTDKLRVWVDSDNMVKVESNVSGLGWEVDEEYYAQ